MRAKQRIALSFAQNDKNVYIFQLTLVMKNILTSGLLRAVSMAKPGPKPVNVFTLVDVGRGLRHWVNAEKARDFKCWV